MSERIDPFLARLDAITLSDLEVLSLPDLDDAGRDAVLARVEASAVSAGRADEVAQARLRAKDEFLRRLNRRALEVTFAGPTWRTVSGRAEDIARLGIAIEDAAVAEVVADVADPDDVAALREPFELAASMIGSSSRQSLDIDGRRGPAMVVAAIAAFLVSGGFAVGAAIAGILGRRGRTTGED